MIIFVVFLFFLFSRVFFSKSGIILEHSNKVCLLPVVSKVIFIRKRYHILARMCVFEHMYNFKSQARIESEYRRKQKGYVVPY